MGAQHVPPHKETLLIGETYTSLRPGASLIRQRFIHTPSCSPSVVAFCLRYGAGVLVEVPCGTHSLPPSLHQKNADMY